MMSTNPTPTVTEAHREQARMWGQKKCPHYPNIRWRVPKEGACLDCAAELFARCEAAEARVQELEQDLTFAHGFHNVAAKERDYAMLRSARIERERDEAQARVRELEGKLVRMADMTALRAAEYFRERDEARAALAQHKTDAEGNARLLCELHDAVARELAIERTDGPDDLSVEIVVGKIRALRQAEMHLTTALAQRTAEVEAVWKFAAYVVECGHSEALAATTPTRERGDTEGGKGRCLILK